MSEDEARRRATPNPDRPRLRRSREAKILPLDEKAAAAYSALEAAVAESQKTPVEGVPIAELDLSESIVQAIGTAGGGEPK